MNSLVGNLFESALKRAQKKKVVESKNDSKALTEATMNDIPHELDDVVHELAELRTKLEDLHKTWEAAGFANLAPLDEITKGVEALTKLVYDNASLLADQEIGAHAVVPEKQQAVVPVPEPEASKEGQVLTAVVPVKSETIKEDDAAENLDMNVGNSNEGEADMNMSNENASNEAMPVEEEQEMTLEECEAYCALPANMNLKKAFKKCLAGFRQNKPESSNGEIVKIILTPKKSLKLQFDGCERPVYAYRDGDFLV